MSPVEPRITFRLQHNGWADLLIESGETRHCVPAISYLTSALDDLLRLGIVIATHGHVGTAQFFHEPGSTLVIGETAWWNGENWEFGARLTAADGPDYGKPELSITQILALPRRFSVTFSSPDSLAGALLHAADAVEAEHGHGGYRALWTGAHGFPVRGVAALRAALATPPSERLDYDG